MYIWVYLLKETKVTVSWNFLIIWIESFYLISNRLNLHETYIVYILYTRLIHR